MSARDAIFGRIRRSLGVSGVEAGRRAAVADRLTRAPRGVVPARGQLEPRERKALFARMATEAFARVEEVRADDVPATIAESLARLNLPAEVRSGADPRLARIPWGQVPTLRLLAGKPSPDDPATVSYAEAGIAETGTLLLISGPENPTSLNFLPRLHIVLIDEGTIDGDAETALERVRTMFGKGRLPRTINLITGPSRSGDIEQTMILGAHGPQALLVLIVAFR